MDKPEETIICNGKWELLNVEWIDETANIEFQIEFTELGNNRLE